MSTSNSFPSIVNACYCPAITTWKTVKTNQSLKCTLQVPVIFNFNHCALVCLYLWLFVCLGSLWASRVTPVITFHSLIILPSPSHLPVICNSLPKLYIPSTLNTDLAAVKFEIMGYLFHLIRSFGGFYLMYKLICQKTAYILTFPACF